MLPETFKNKLEAMSSILCIISNDPVDKSISKKYNNVWIFYVNN